MASVSRNVFIVRRILAGIVAVVCVGSAAVAYAQAELSEQKLDRIDVIERQGATNVALDINVPTAIKPWVATDYPAVSGTAFVTCVNTATRGLFCNDNNAFRHWPNPEKLPPLDPVDGRVLFSCANPVFGFDNPCTGFAMDIFGNMWVAGPKKSKFSLYKVVQGACPSNQWTSFTTPAGSFCAREFASGRSQLINLTVVDGATAEAFPYSEGGVIAVEGGKSVTFFRNVPLATPVVLAPSTVLGLTGGDQVQAATLLQRPLPVNSRNWLVMTTLNGKLLSREIPFNPATVTPVLNHAGQVNIVSATTCGPTALYDVHWSEKTHATIVSDRRGCRLMSMLSNIDSPSFTSTTPLAFSSLQVIASTTPSSPQTATLTAPPEGVSIAPGVEVDLRADCGFDNNGNPLECGIVPDGGDPNFAAAASLKGVTIDDGTPGGLTVFHVPESQDCRYTSFAEQSAECKNGAILAPDGRVIDDPNDPTEYTPDGMPLHPELLFLDVAKLVPVEVTQGVTFPRMLMGPRYKALDDTNTFGMVIGETDDGVRFRETFLANFHLGDLIPGRKLGCGEDTTIDLVNGPLLDILLTISEDFTDPGGLPGGGFQHAHTLVNAPGCDDLDPPAAGTRWSAYLYGIKIAPEQVPNRTNPNLIEVRYPDSIFGRLVLSLFQDFGELIDDYLCVDRDGGTGAPISASACTTLQESFDNTYDKLFKCVQSATDPMNPSGIRTCQGFESQYLQFAAQVNGLTPASLDPANRVGGAIARLINWRYMYDTQYLPSIPTATGFIDGL